MDCQKTIDSLIAWIKSETPAHAKVLIPISGGSDSALCFWLYNQALPGRVKGVYIGTNLRAKEWFEQQGKVQYSNFQVTHNNPEVERWAHFLTLSLQEDRILVGSRNRTEDTLGTFSHASKVSSCLPLAHLWKSQVMELCVFIGIPPIVINSSKRADPACGRPQRMADIPFEVVDAFLQIKGNLSAASRLLLATPQQMQYLETIYDHNAYKKALPLKGLASS